MPLEYSCENNKKIIKTKNKINDEEVKNDKEIRFLSEYEILEMRDSIEKMNKEIHIEILKILKKNKTSFSENGNGVFLNLSELPNSTLLEIEKYINYIKQQQRDFEKIEKEKEIYKQQFFDEN